MISHRANYFFLWCFFGIIIQEVRRLIYLDASATTKVKNEVLDEFIKVQKEIIGNPNSSHQLGEIANQKVVDATNQIANILKVKPNEIIYTSGASESNNLAIKGVAFRKQNLGKHIITTRFEHPSTIGPLSWLTKLGFEIDFVETDKEGKIDLNHLKELLRDDTILITISSVNSELGLIQPIDKIGKLLKAYPNCYFHVDITQSIGKHEISLKHIDLASLSAHKFYGIKGIGVLIKKENIEIEPLIHGGSSTTIYRSGTPSPALIASLAKALELANNDLENHEVKIKQLNTYLRTELTKYPDVLINSPDSAVSYILNFSVIGADPNKFQKLLSEKGVYLSVGTACATGYEVSPSVLALTKDEARASSSLRISLTNDLEKVNLEEFIKIFNKCYNEIKKV